MNIAGLNVNAAAIGAGMYELICAKGDEAIVAFGMIPLYAVEALRESLKAKLAPLEYEGEIKGRKASEVIAEIERAVVSEIYGAASAAGRMVV